MNPRLITAPRPTAATSLPLLLLLSTFATSPLLRAETPKPKTPAAPAAPAAPIVAEENNTVPYTLEVEEVKDSQMPALHSFASGYAEGKWLLIGGRKAGLHGFDADGSKNFPRPTANTIAYVVDPAKNELLGKMDLQDALAKRPDLLGPLTATNPEFVQVGNNLYIIGGYGKDLTDPQGAMVTFGSVIRINLSGLITDIVNKLPGVIEKHIERNPTSDRRLQVAGGQLKYHDGRFYLVFGQEFRGHYTLPTGDYNKAGGEFQKYTEKIRILTLNDNLSINQYTEVDGGYDDALPYHRRDLNVSDIIVQHPGANGKPGTEEAACVVYGGVFMAGQIGGHVHPVDIFYANPFSAQSHDTTPTYARVQSDFKQALNHYDCANFTLYDSTTGDSYTTLFGGISQFHYDAANKTLIQDAINFPVDGLPFINTVSVIRHGAKGAISQNIQPAPGWAPGPTLLGTDAQFLVHHSKLHPKAIMEGGVINLAKLGAGEHVIGHILGGIEAFGPYTGLITQGTSSQASTRLFQIKLKTTPSAVTPMPPLPPGPTPYKQ